MKDSVRWSERVRKARSTLGVSQQSFAELMQTSSVSVSNWEGETTKPTGWSAVALEMLEVSIRRLSPLEVLQRLRRAVGNSQALVRILVWMSSSEGPPSSLGRLAAPDPAMAPPPDEGSSSPSIN